jgi:hypothetical protein
VDVSDDVERAGAVALVEGQGLHQAAAPAAVGAG